MYDDSGRDILIYTLQETDLQQSLVGRGLGVLVDQQLNFLFAVRFDRFPVAPRTTRDGALHSWVASES